MQNLDYQAAKMSVIANIQAMNTRLSNSADFDLLWRYKLEALREMQTNLLVKYNQSFK